MALFRQFCTCVLFLFLSGVQAQNADCGVQDNTVSVQENNPPEALITNITAADGVTVKINPSVLNGDQFEIQNSQLILKNPVDYEVSAVLIVELQCFRGDVFEDSLRVIVNIINVNDNPPEFPETNITVNVQEDITVNTTVVPQANLTAKDADKDTIYYNLTADPPVGLEYFNIEGVNNPQISLRKTLDYEKINFMQFSLYAMDGKPGEALHTATATITIHILQTDRRPPWFQPCTLFGGNIVCINRGYTGKINISENLNESLVLEPGPLYAIDGDRDLNEKVKYEIAGGNDDDTFSINEDSGEITVKKLVNTLKTFMLYVVASQANNPYRYSQTTVQIKVVRRNDHKPYFDKTLYTGTVSVGLPASSLVMETGEPSVPLRISAADDDFPEKFNPDITYQIQNSTNFTVTRDGFLLTAVVLDVASAVTLLAIANDTATLQEDSTLITVDVTPLEATTVLPTTTTSTGAGTTISEISDLPPGTITTLPVTPSASTTRNTAITEKPATGSTSGSIIPPFVTTTKSPITTVSTLQPQTTNSPITGINQATDRTDESSVETTFQSGVTKPSISTATGGTVQTVTSASSQTRTTTTKHPITGESPATDGQSTAKTPSQTRTTTTKHPITGESPATDGQSTAKTPSQIGTTTKHPITGESPATDGQSTAKTPSQIGTTTKHPITGESPTTDDMGESSTREPQRGTTKAGINTTTDMTVSSTVTTPLYNGTTNYITGDATTTTRTTTLSITTSSSNVSTVCQVVTGGQYTAEHMVAVGVTLGCLLLVTLVLLGLISYKYYKLKQGHGEESKTIEGFANGNFQGDENPNSGGNEDMLPASVESENDSPVAEEIVESSQGSEASGTNKEGEEGNADTDSEKEVRSILTKDRRMSDDGYKAVWFKEDIDPEAKDDVLMIENDSDVEWSRNESDSDDADSQVDDLDSGVSGGDSDGSRAGSGKFFTQGRAQLPETDSTGDAFLQDTEENDAFL